MTEKELASLRSVLADLDYIHYLIRKAQGMDSMEQAQLQRQVKRAANRLAKVMYPSIPKRNVCSTP